ncbi:hypothetical protein JAAARDRAFT_29240 [Jaapia argillacea MUCL 33604]|uniref:Thioredoxin domain-containing protein n=1 Tax=Jaapia argillacea MUCL 33604 TaxID=933084 RepID=A0A067Q8B3_9AGAM|nr:hypothetical protein JAAARDRAFT_29240 [Jaapia argillacea MUCL 33604]
MSITHLTSVSQLNGILGTSKDKLSVIDFHATWCGPCHMIAPTFEALSKQYKNVNFLKCDVDAARDVASLYSVSAMPTFIFLKGTTKVHQVRGANKAALEEGLRQYSSSSSSSTGAFTGQGQTLGGAPAKPDLVEGATAGLRNLDPQFKILLYLVGAYAVFWYLSS